MRHVIAALLMIAPAAEQVQAEELKWTPLTDEQIRVVLTGRVLAYGESWQDFRASGRTLYHAGADAWGYWRVQNDQYCSQWPPSDLWACYTMDQSGDRVRFVAKLGDITAATFKD